MPNAEDLRWFKQQFHRLLAAGVATGSAIIGGGMSWSRKHEKPSAERTASRPFSTPHFGCAE
jgi:hypothetical protein